MGLWDKVAESKTKQPEGKPKVVFREASKGHSHNGRPCKSFGSCAIQNFEQINAKKKAMAKKLPRKDNSDSVLGDKGFKYIRKNGKSIGFTKED